LRERQIEVLVYNAGFWSVHILRVSLCVLLALACLALLVRLVLGRRLATRLGAGHESWALVPRLPLKLVVSSMGVAGSCVIGSLRRRG